jgi:RNA polymerase sigma-70 factor (ECF subfamily)
MSETPPPQQFPTTHWSIISRLRSDDTAEAQEAVEEIFTRYRYPLYGFLRAGGLNHENAEDVLQGFFEKMLRNDSLSEADSDRGKLRTFLLTCLSRYKLNWQRGERRRHERVRAEADLWDTEEDRYRNERHVTHETPEHFYDRRWATELIDQVRLNLRQQYENGGKLERHDALIPFLSTELAETEKFPQIAVRLDLTENALRVSLHRLRRDFRDLLLHEIKLTVGEGQSIKGELQNLLDIFG